MTVRNATIRELSARHPSVGAFLTQTDPGGAKPNRTLDGWLSGLTEERLSVIGLDRERIAERVENLVHEAAEAKRQSENPVRSLRILGGRDKTGAPENLDLTLNAGDVVCIVGPTGSGKSRLLADIECLAQGDTQSGRRVLINGAPPEPGQRFAPSRRLIAQLSQNMNFVVDLSVAEFIAMHAECRMIDDAATVARQVIACANDLAGERFSAECSLTQLSGGQTRALMIADTALLSGSPVVLIDEIENAGIDRKRALDLLISRDKIVLVSTHDPILALLGDRRLVIAQGAVAEIIETGDDERANLARLEALDRAVGDVRARLRRGERIADLDLPGGW
jgi:ABC-type lipoprotein export system ATPase subunit